MIGPFFGFVVLTLVAQAHAMPPKKIMGGFNAAPGQFPYQASLRIRGQHTCGGAIISNRHILTAAHCITQYRNLMTIVTGTTLNNPNSGQIHTPLNIWKHSGFSNHVPGLPNDIAIISLTKPIKFNNLQKKIDLPSAPTPGGVNVTLSGWGHDNPATKKSSARLKYLPMRTVTTEECQKRRISQIRRMHICAFHGNGQGPCAGDSGGPLVYNGTLVGLVSFGEICPVHIPDVFTNVYHYLNWIKMMMAAI